MSRSDHEDLKQLGNKIYTQEIKPSSKECANCGMKEDDYFVSNSTFWGYDYRTSPKMTAAAKVDLSETKTFNSSIFCKDIDYKIDYRYSEDKSLQEVKKYIDSTYDRHYRSGTDDDMQCIDVWLSRPSGITTCRDVIQKYAWRLGEKGNKKQHKEDVMKIIHYCFFILHKMRINEERN